MANAFLKKPLLKFTLSSYRVKSSVERIAFGVEDTVMSNM